MPILGFFNKKAGLKLNRKQLKAADAWLADFRTLLKGIDNPEYANCFRVVRCKRKGEEQFVAIQFSNPYTGIETSLLAEITQHRTKKSNYLSLSLLDGRGSINMSPQRQADSFRTLGLILKNDIDYARTQVPSVILTKDEYRRVAPQKKRVGRPNVVDRLFGTRPARTYRPAHA